MEAMKKLMPRLKLAQGFMHALDERSSVVSNHTIQMVRKITPLSHRVVGNFVQLPIQDSFLLLGLFGEFVSVT